MTLSTTNSQNICLVRLLFQRRKLLQAKPPILVHALGVHICGRNLQFLIGTTQG